MASLCDCLRPARLCGISHRPSYFPCARLPLPEEAQAERGVGWAGFAVGLWAHQCESRSPQEDTISLNHNWVNGCNLGHMWRFLQQELCAVQQEVIEWKDSMPDWHQHCQVQRVPGPDTGKSGTSGDQGGVAGTSWGG